MKNYTVCFNVRTERGPFFLFHLNLFLFCKCHDTFTIYLRIKPLSSFKTQNIKNIFGLTI